MYAVGYPGGAILPLLDSIHRSMTVRFVLSRHEQGAGHMAEGYARAGGRIGVVLVTSGPGVTNVVTPLYDAYMDEIPLVVIAGQVETKLMGTWAFQEADAISITRSCTKWNARVENIDALSTLMSHAFQVATAERPGPVLIEVPKDILRHACVVGVNGHAHSTNPSISGLVSSPLSASADHQDLRSGTEKEQNIVATVRGKPCSREHAMTHALRLISASSKAIILAGHGIAASGSSRYALAHLSRKCQIPVATTLHGVGLTDPKDDLSLGMTGVYGSACANYAIQNADVIVVLGARLDDRVTAELDSFAPAARDAFSHGQGGILRFELVPSRLNSPIRAAVGIVGRAESYIEILAQDIANREDRSEWLQLIQQQSKVSSRPNVMTFVDSAKLSAAEVIRTLSRMLTCRSDDVVVTTGVGQHQMSTAHNFSFVRPGAFITSGGSGTMGFGLPAAIGAQLACTRSIILDIDGDASFVMTACELLTAVEADLAVKVLVINNNGQGMITQLQTDHYQGRLAHSQQRNPDFVLLARAMGVQSHRAADPQELEGLLCWLLDSSGPALLEVCVRSEYDL